MRPRAAAVAALVLAACLLPQLASAHNWKCRSQIRRGVALHGGSLRGMPLRGVSSPEECCHKCGKNPACKAWTQDIKRKLCYLKRATGWQYRANPDAPYEWASSCAVGPSCPKLDCVFDNNACTSSFECCAGLECAWTNNGVGPHAKKLCRPEPPPPPGCTTDGKCKSDRQCCPGFKCKPSKFAIPPGSTACFCGEDGVDCKDSSDCCVSFRCVKGKCSLY